MLYALITIQLNASSLFTATHAATVSVPNLLMDAVIIMLETA